SLDVATSLGNLGIVAEKQRNRVEAERLARQAWALVRQQAAAVSGDEARQAFGASTAVYAAHLLRYQLALGKTALAFTTLEEGRAEALQQLLLERPVLAKMTNNHPLWSAYQKALTERDRAGRTAAQARVAEARARRELAAQQVSHAAPDRLAPAQAALAAAQQK